MEMFTSTNKGLINLLKMQQIITSARVEQAMLAVDRAHFTRDPKYAYEDMPRPIGYDQTISAPSMHAICLELLRDYLHPGMKALDVGSGSGYLCACMARMVAPPHSEIKGRVFGIEFVSPLVDFSLKNLRKDETHKKMLEEGVIQIMHGDGWKGLPQHAPFNAIHVGAAAETVPQALVEQLTSPGRLVIPIGAKYSIQNLCTVDKDMNGKVGNPIPLLSVRYVPLVNPDNSK